MNIDDKTTAIMEQVTRRQVSEKFAQAINEAKRQRQTMTAKDERTKSQIIADALLTVYRAGVYDGLSAARDEYGMRYSDDGK